MSMYSRYRERFNTVWPPLLREFLATIPDGWEGSSLMLWDAIASLAGPHGCAPFRNAVIREIDGRPGILREMGFELRHRRTASERTVQLVRVKRST